ncbi:MAG: alpha-ketoglutarate-dependent dioxygenase AlkB [Tsuneonella sp.]
MVSQPDLFPAEPMVGGFSLIEEAISRELESTIESAIDRLPLAPFQFGQWQGKRLTANFGSAYDYQRGRPVLAPDFPAWIADLRGQLAPLFGADAEPYVQALATRYDPGAGIGWHRDRPQYGSVIGLSLSAPATLRLRRRLPEGGFERRNVGLRPRSAYLLSGEVRDEWEHSIAPMAVTRRSLTLRTMRNQSVTTP